MRRCSERDPKNQLFLNSEPDLYTSLAECYAVAGQGDPAVQAMRTALERFHEIESKRPLAADEEDRQKSDLVRLAQWERH